MLMTSKNTGAMSILRSSPPSPSSRRTYSATSRCVNPFPPEVMPETSADYLSVENKAHGNSEALEQLKQVGFPVAEADGMAIFEAVSYEKIFECFTDDEYKKVVVPDEEKFLDRGKSLAFPAGIVNVFDDPT